MAAQPFHDRDGWVWFDGEFVPQRDAKVHVLTHAMHYASAVFEGEGLKVTAFGIPHANMPTLAYRVETRDGTIVFSSDQNGTDPTFVDFAKGANVLIMHLAIAAGAPPSMLHASPAVVGRAPAALDAGA